MGIGDDARERVEGLEGGDDGGGAEQLLVQDGAELAHHRRRTDTVADHVTHDEGDAAVGSDDGVEPVAAGCGALGRQEVPRGDVEPRRHRQRLGQERLLQLGHDGDGVAIALLRDLLGAFGPTPSCH